MEFSYVAGFGPITRDEDAALGFWSRGLGIEFEEAAPGYFHSTTVGGTKAFALWPLDQAAESTFGAAPWPADVPVPQAWIEFEVESPEAVSEAVEDLRARGLQIVTEAHTEPWGQTTARLLSPEHLLVGVSYLPDFHPDDDAG